MIDELFFELLVQLFVHIVVVELLQCVAARFFKHCVHFIRVFGLFVFEILLKLFVVNHHTIIESRHIQLFDNILVYGVQIQFFVGI